MKRVLPCVVFGVLLTGCHVLPVEYESGANWALTENPLSDKCVCAQAEDGEISVGGLASFISDVSIQGKKIKYMSVGTMCEKEMADLCKVYNESPAQP